MALERLGRLSTGRLIAELPRAKTKVVRVKSNSANDIDAF
jgi:hypothetical protein